MEYSPNIAKIGALLGDNTRARMLSALMHGKALTASELANDAGITAQTATTHLAKLTEAGLLTIRKQGRHKYFALAGEKVAALIETLMGLTADNEPHRISTGPHDARMRKARVCYNHLAGEMGIQLYESLTANGYLLSNDGSLILSEPGQQFVRDFGIDLDSLRASRTPLCRECLDWSERRSHLAGSLGRAFMSRFETLHWARRDTGRIITFSLMGERKFNAQFGLRK